MARLFLAAVCLFAAPATALGQTDPPRAIFVEGYPRWLAARMELRERALQAQAAAIGRDRLAEVIEIPKQWRRGATVTVAFRGGSNRLCGEVAEVADEWTEHGNIKFSFTDADDKVRRWSEEDDEFAADIRIAFDDEGFWSLLGNESVDEDLILPSETSMNLENFDNRRPRNWKGVVRHEFGHALGFHHEHQHPVAPCDFRWEDDPNYEPTTDEFGQFIPDEDGRRPGVYTVLGGPPNEWPRRDVDEQLRKLTGRSNRFLVTEFDPDSIMKYAFEDWMFVAGRRSHCFSEVDNEVLSNSDKEIMGLAYPEDGESNESVDRLAEIAREFEAAEPAGESPAGAARKARAEHGAR